MVCCVALLSLYAEVTHAGSSTYTKTQYPIVLAHGMGGFDALFGVVDYFYGIEAALRDGGAKVYTTRVPPFASTEARGEALLEQVEYIVAATGAAKVNLIGHSHGGIDVRYVAGKRPDLVASVTAVGSPHAGAALADYLRANVRDGSFSEGVLAFFANSFGAVLSLLTGHSDPQDAVAGLESLTTEGMAAFNAKFPQGLPTKPCGQGPEVAGGIRYYSWSGTATLTHLLDPSDGYMALTSWFYDEPNDGLVGKCSSHFGRVIRDDYRMNHADEVNQVLGLTSWFETNPKSLFRAHANRLKNVGL